HPPHHPGGEDAQVRHEPPGRGGRRGGLISRWSPQRAGALTQLRLCFFKCLKNKNYFLGMGIAMTPVSDRLLTVRHPREEHEPSRPLARNPCSRRADRADIGRPSSRAKVKVVLVDGIGNNNL